MAPNVEVLARLNLMGDLVTLARQPEQTGAALDAIEQLVPAVRRHAGSSTDVLPGWLAAEVSDLA